jgi:hypothetical protein
MKNGTKIYQKIKKIKKVKTSLSKHKILNKSNNTKLENLIKTKEYEEDYPVSFIKSKSLKKLKIYNGFNKKKDNAIKLPSLQKHLYTNANDSKMISNFLNRNNTIKKIKLNTNNINNINNLYSKNKSSKKLLSKHSGSTYNLKKSQNYIKTKNINISTSGNLGVVRHLDRKIIKGNKNINMPKHGYKLFATTKIINNFNNQINQNKNKEIYTICDNNQNNNDNKKIDVLFDIEKKVTKIQKYFRNHLKDEEDNNIKNENKNKNNNVIIDIISDISLSEEELNFSEEDSFDNIDFSLDDEEI